MRKYFTLSFDDGVTQDRRLVQLLRKYGLKCTFNVNSGLLGKAGELNFGDGKSVSHNKITAEELPSLYDGFEVVVHTRTHPMLTGCSVQRILEEVIGDSVRLSELTGYAVRGMAYPGGHPNFDRLVTETIREFTDIRYARTIVSTYDFGFPEDFMEWNPTAHILDEKTETLIERFAQEKTDGLLYLWGHSHELDLDDGWARVEKIFKRLSELGDAQSMTNMQVWKSCRN